MTEPSGLLAEQYEFRGDMVGALERDLLGPSSENEELDEGPLFRYITGVLFPVDAELNVQEPDDPEDGSSGGEDAGYDPGVALSLTRHPSSMGMSFSVDLENASTVTVQVTAARYESVEQDAPATPDDPDEMSRRPRAARRRDKWRRQPISPEPFAIDVSTTGVVEQPLADGLELYCLVRPAYEGRVPVTVVLRNTLNPPPRGHRDAWCWFQPTMTVSTEKPAFVERRELREAQLDDDDLHSYDLLFRSARSFAVGHGCSVTWDQTDHPTVDRLATTFLPTYELPLATPRDAAAGTDLRMAFLAEESIEQITASLMSLVDDYRSWIDTRQQEIPQLDTGLQETAERHLEAAAKAADRIESGVDLIREDGEALRAFRLMNRAMRDQRTRQDWIRAGAAGPLPDGTSQAWRPFQIAFILLCLRGIADDREDDRDVADLLWFPTGGGKTEAYLGLIAFTIFLRRLRDPDDDAVAVLMRYTLRLLTLQQFERAATLICAMECIRRSDPELLAAAPISLGLWVGLAATPNTFEQARASLNRLRSGQEPRDGNPMQLTQCPWCGTPVTPDNFRLNRSTGSVVLHCTDNTCEFGDELPLYVIDQDVYRVRPSLLIGTVDKFAMMAWKENVRAIFAADSTRRPPDLVVQDELHLISGPLGTMVGLYETAVDAAAGSRAKPKVVASTATIRRADRQVRAVFDRSSFQFPPPGIDVSDSYFAQQAERHEKGTRLYVGLLTPGTSQTTLLVRTYAALLQAALELPGSDDARDPYWTLLGYFNSLRVLGGAFMQVNDDVPDRIRLVAGRHGRDARQIPEDPLELTSRIESSKIPLSLAMLAESYPDENSPDVVLATNMISVGMDVDRLGLMAVMGQPQATAEYIQATSRVGRKYPGLVVVMYNSARSRDRSHYENFLSYHQSLYREVEATSATPFAVRARDRGLHGVLVSMARLLVTAAASDDAARHADRFESQLHSLADRIVARAESVDPDSADETRKQLDELIDIWVEEGPPRSGLKYSVRDNPNLSLLIEAGKALTDDRVSLGTDALPWPTLMSLRDVDAESSLYLIPNRDWRKK